MFNRTLLIVISICLISCTKEIIQQKLTVSVTPANGGSVSPPSNSYEKGSNVSLVATPTGEYLFKQWQGSISGTSNPTSITMDADKSVTGVFEKRQYPLTLTIEGSGTVKEEVIGIAGQALYPSGTTVRLTAISGAGNMFKEWKGDILGKDSVITATITKPLTLTATFAAKVILPDYSTKYTSFSSATFTKAMTFNALHQETMKVLKINKKPYLVSASSELYGTTYDFFRSFEIDTTSGQLTENTSTLLGGYKEVGFPKSPFYYEDLNGDGIKDLFEVDHGKETPSLIVNGQYPGFVNHLFLGTSDGKFNYVTVAGLTDIKRFHHNAGVGDMDGDGDNDLVLQYFGSDEMYYFKNTNGLKKDRTLTPNNSTGAVLNTDIDNDGTMDIISAPYIDRGSSPSTYVLKMNLTQNEFTSTRISPLTPFGQSYGCYKLFALKNPKNPKINNLFYFVEGGQGDQKIFRSSDADMSKLDEISKVQSTYKSNGTRDYIIMDLNFDGWDDVFFITNSGDNLNQRIWLNKGDNTFENPKWEVDSALNDIFIPLSSDEKTGRTKILYIQNYMPIKTKVIDVYTKKR